MYEARLAAIAAAIREGGVGYTEHALTQMKERGIGRPPLEGALAGEDTAVIEDYPDDRRGASSLVLCWISGRALHVQVSYPPRPVVITTYWPDAQPERWDAGFRRRLR